MKNFKLFLLVPFLFSFSGCNNQKRIALYCDDALFYSIASHFQDNDIGFNFVKETDYNKADFVFDIEENFSCLKKANRLKTIAKKHVSSNILDCFDDKGEIPYGIRASCLIKNDTLYGADNDNNLNAFFDKCLENNGIIEYHFSALISYLMSDELLGNFLRTKEDNSLFVSLPNNGGELLNNIHNHLKTLFSKYSISTPSGSYSIKDKDIKICISDIFELIQTQSHDLFTINCLPKYTVNDLTINPKTYTYINYFGLNDNSSLKDEYIDAFVEGMYTTSFQKTLYKNVNVFSVVESEEIDNKVISNDSAILNFSTDNASGKNIFIQYFCDMILHDPIPNYSYTEYLKDLVNDINSGNNPVRYN
ncbi:MAG: hypothetical protein E7175_04345 [Erysipelotrichaceae bacterium]|nr:hypothetical protein [Erysipelotrichaceae bacterium]